MTTTVKQMRTTVEEKQFRGEKYGVWAGRQYCHIACGQMAATDQRLSTAVGRALPATTSSAADHLHTDKNSFDNREHLFGTNEIRTAASPRYKTLLLSVKPTDNKAPKPLSVADIQEIRKPTNSLRRHLMLLLRLGRSLMDQQIISHVSIY